MPFGDLQQWLQLTYEIETKYFEERRLLTEKQLISAKDMVQSSHGLVSADEKRFVVVYCGRA